jgi:hypothetical protein
VLAGASIVYGQGVVGDAYALFIGSNGNVGIGTMDPAYKLDVKGAINASSLLINGAPFNSGVAQWTSGSDGRAYLTNVKVGIGTKDPDAQLEIQGNVGNSSLLVKGSQPGMALANDGPDGHTWNIWSVGRGEPMPPGSLAFLDEQTNTYRFGIDNNGNVGIGTMNPAFKLNVAGSVRADGAIYGRVRHQIDDQPETWFEKPVEGYHMTLTAGKYAGKSKTIPMDVLEDLCGKPDGCQVRLAMTRWDSQTETESASREFLFYYSKINRRWRTSTEVTGQLGDGVRQDANHSWHCYFTDAS